MQRSRLVRRLLLFVMIAAVSVPMFQAHPQTSFACSNPSCSASSGGSTTLDTYFSPITPTFNSTVCSEYALSGEHDITLPCTLSYSIADRRGNNEGFLVSIASGGFTNSLGYDSITGKPVTIPPSDITVSSSSATIVDCYGLNSNILSCEPTYPVSSSIGAALPASSPGLPVLVGCPVQDVGEGIYAGTMGMTVTLPLNSPENEVFGKFPLSWSGSFTVTVSEGPSIDYVGTYGCRAASSA